MSNLQFARTFILAGKAIFTVQNTVSGNRYTYRVRKANDADLWFVAVLTGNDNESDYSYLGIIGSNGMFRRTAKSRVSAEALSHKAFAWLWARVNIGLELPEQVTLHHEGRCGRCGRRLTVPESIETGFGPECAGRL